MPADLAAPPSWVGDAVFYQVFPDRFARSGRVPAPGPLEPWDAPPTDHGFKGGDLWGVADRLPELADLGITALYLNPVFASASNHRYHPYDYERVDPLLGGDEALGALLDAAHARGMRVVLDAVFNHASRGFWPFHHVLEAGRDSPYREWFHLDGEALDAGRPLRAYPPESRAGALDPEWGRLHGESRESLRTLGYRAWWDLPALPKLRTEHPAVREYLMRVAERWTAFGIDGWRLDVPLDVEAAGFWEEFRSRVRAINREAYIVAEVWRTRPELLDGRTFDALMGYPFAATILSYVTAGHLDRGVVAQQPELAAALGPDDAASFLDRLAGIAGAYPPPFDRSQLTLIGSHDTPRFLTMAGNDRPSLRLAWLVLLSMPGAPCIYYGDEIGMTGEHDPGCRGAYPTDPGSRDEELRRTLAALIGLRHRLPALRSSTVVPLGTAGLAAAYRRGLGPEAVIVAINPGDTGARLEVEGTADGGQVIPVDGLPSGAAISAPGGRLAIDVPARSGFLVAGA